MAVGDRREVELDENFRSLNSIPVLSSSHPLEKQGRRCYTWNIFAIFQQEYKCNQSMFHEKMSKTDSKITYSVRMMDDEEENKKHHIVSFDASKVLVKCNCAKFRTEGILCSHLAHLR